MFAAGSAIAVNKRQIASFLSSVAPYRIGLLWLAAFALLMTPFDRNKADFLLGPGAVLLIWIVRKVRSNRSM